MAGLSDFFTALMKAKNASPVAQRRIKLEMERGSPLKEAYAKEFKIDTSPEATSVRRKEQGYDAKDWFRGEEKGTPEQFELGRRGHGYPHDLVTIPFTDDLATAESYGKATRYAIRDVPKKAHADFTTGKMIDENIMSRPDFLGFYETRTRGPLKSDLRMTPYMSDWLKYDPIDKTPMVKVKGVADIGPKMRGMDASEKATNLYVRDPGRIRAADALFDPDLKGLPFTNYAIVGIPAGTQLNKPVSVMDKEYSSPSTVVDDLIDGLKDPASWLGALGLGGSGFAYAQGGSVKKSFGPLSAKRGMREYSVTPYYPTDTRNRVLADMLKQNPEIYQAIVEDELLRADPYVRMNRGEFGGSIDFLKQKFGGDEPTYKAHGGPVHMAGGGQDSEMREPTNFRPTLPARTKRQALKEGLANALPYAATWPLMVTDVVESGLDALRGTKSPNRMTQAASAIKQLFGGDPIPQEHERGVEPWDVSKYELAGSLPAATANPLRAVASIPAALGHGAESFARSMAGSMPSVIKQKGGNWLSGSVEDALRGLKRQGRTIEGVQPPNPEALARLRAGGEDGVARNETINSWIEGPLTKYVKTRMASPDDEVRRLAEQGVLHYEIPYDPIGAWRVTGDNKLGVSDLAKQWEGLSDSALTMAPKKDWIAETQATRIDPRVGADDMVYGTTGDVHNLGFPHLIDELSNALNPTSGLPRNLQLTPEAVQQMSMEKAVRRVAEINAWRAAQKAETNRALAEQAALVREYAENNPKGLRWAELKKGEQLPEGWSVRNQELGETIYVDPTGKEFIAGGQKDPLRQALADQLKYEGDTMGHCVGGYCDDVLSGRSRIFSLRDAKGEPHVTIEVKPQKSYGTEHLEKFREQAQKDALASGVNPGTPDDPSAAFLGAVNRRMEELAKENLPLRIQQIKGKQNRAPNEEYLPFVQDFVRNPFHGGQWSDVGDFQNTGLRKLNYEMFGSLGPSGEAAVDQLRERGRHFLTDKELQSAYDAVYNTGRLPEGFASGGSIRLPPRDGAQPTLGTRGLTAEPVSGYNSAVPSWDIFAEAE